MAAPSYPFADDAERAVLGAALKSTTALYEVAERLRRDDFYREYHREIYDAIESLYKQQRDVDIVTVSEELKKRKMLSVAGGGAYLGELAANVPTIQNAEQYARIIREKSILRQLIDRAQEIIAMSAAEEEDAGVILSEAERKILEIAQGSQRSDVSLLHDVIKDSMMDIRAFSESGRKLRGITTGFGHLDKITSGFQRSDLVVLAARPGMGKTSLALNMAINAAKAEGAIVLIFSIEMSKKSLANRMLSTLSRVPLAEILDGNALESTEKTEMLTSSIEDYSGMGIFLDESQGNNIGEMKNKARRVRQRNEGHLDLVIIDYLQLMSLEGKKQENRTLELGDITRQIKLMARDLDCPVLLLSQVSRENEKRRGKPMLSDLRDSGAIEQDADIVMFIHNMEEKEQEEYNRRNDADGKEFHYDRERMRQLMILKHRNGEQGELILNWTGKYTRFSEPYGGDVYGSPSHAGAAAATYLDDDDAAITDEHPW